MTVTYQLEHSIIEAAAPVEVGHKTGQFWFPTLHQIGTSTLICAVVRGDDTAQGQWPIDLLWASSLWELPNSGQRTLKHRIQVPTRSFNKIEA